MAKTKEKKPTAAQLAREARQRFISRCYLLSLNKLVEETTYSKGKARITISHKNGNRYIRLNKYGMSMALLFYRDGNADIVLKECFHADYKEQIFQYTEDSSEQDRFIDRLTDILSWLFIQFVDEYGVDFHTFMDFIHFENSLDAAREEALRYMHLDEEGYHAATHC